jgi:hypothetical protein
MLDAGWMFLMFISMVVCFHPERFKSAIKHLAFINPDQFLKAKFENGTVLGEPNVMTDERYRLVERYEQDTLADADPPFKRILFWNDVHNLHTIAPINISDIIKCQ